MHPLPTPARRLVAGALALVATAGFAGTAQAAPTAVERSGTTALNYSMPGQELAFHFVRKAGG